MKSLNEYYSSTGKKKAYLYKNAKDVIIKFTTLQPLENLQPYNH